MIPISEEDYIKYSIEDGIIQHAAELFVEIAALKLLAKDPRTELLAKSALKNLKDLIEKE